jgi:hypothetical protein
VNNPPALSRAGDTVVVTAIDRLGRSVAEVTRTIADLSDRRITLRALREGIDTATPTGRAMGPSWPPVRPVPVTGAIVGDDIAVSAPWYAALPTDPLDRGSHQARSPFRKIRRRRGCLLRSGLSVIGANSRLRQGRTQRPHHPGGRWPGWVKLGMVAGFGPIWPTPEASATAARPVR